MRSTPSSADVPDSIQKLAQVEELCRAIGVLTLPTWFDRLLVVPVLSWHHQVGSCRAVARLAMRRLSSVELLGASLHGGKPSSPKVPGAHPKRNGAVRIGMIPWSRVTLAPVERCKGSFYSAIALLGSSGGGSTARLASVHAGPMSAA